MLNRYCPELADGEPPIRRHEKVLEAFWKPGTGNPRGTRECFACSLAFYRLVLDSDNLTSEFDDALRAIILSCSKEGIDSSINSYHGRITMKELMNRGGSGRVGDAGDAAIKILAIRAGQSKLDVFVKEVEGFTDSLNELRSDEDALTQLAFTYIDERCCWTW